MHRGLAQSVGYCANGGPTWHISLFSLGSKPKHYSTTPGWLFLGEALATDCDATMQRTFLQTGRVSRPTRNVCSWCDPGCADSLVKYRHTVLVILAYVI